MGGNDAKVRLIAWSRNGRYFYTAGGARYLGLQGKRP